MPCVKREPSRTRWIRERNHYREPEDAYTIALGHRALGPSVYFGDPNQRPRHGPAAGEPYPHVRPANRRPPKWARKFPVVESTLVEHNGKFDHLSARVLECEDVTEKLTELTEKQATAIEQIQAQLREAESQTQSQQSELQGQLASLEASVLDLLRKVESNAELKSQPPRFLGQNLPLSPPLTPIISPLRLAELDEAEQSHGTDIDGNNTWSWFPSADEGSNAGEQHSTGDMPLPLMLSPVPFVDPENQPAPIPVIDLSVRSSYPLLDPGEEEQNQVIPCVDLGEDDVDMGLPASPPNSLLATPAKTPQPQVSPNIESSIGSLSSISDAIFMDPVDLADNEAQSSESPSYDQELRRKFVRRLRRVLAAPPTSDVASMLTPGHTPKPELPRNADDVEEMLSMILPTPIHCFPENADYNAESNLFSCDSWEIEDPDDTEATATRILEEAAGFIDITPPRKERPMSRAELRFTSSVVVKDLHFDLQKRLIASGCEELWKGGLSPVVMWDGTAKVDEWTKELLVNKLGWATEVVAESP